MHFTWLFLSSTKLINWDYSLKFLLTRKHLTVWEAYLWESALWAFDIKQGSCWYIFAVCQLCTVPWLCSILYLTPCIHLEHQACVTALKQTLWGAREPGEVTTNSSDICCQWTFCTSWNWTHSTSVVPPTTQNVINLLRFILIEVAECFF